MRIFYELRYNIIELVRTFYLKGVPARFQNIWNIFIELLAGQVRQNCRATSSSCQEHPLQPSSPFVATIVTSINMKTRTDSDINSDYKVSSYDKLYNWRTKWDTVSFVRAHQRNYWNALTISCGHADDGCSCNHRAVSPREQAHTVWNLIMITSSNGNIFNITAALWGESTGHQWIPLIKSCNAELW